jgi:hypothetical protein
MAKRYLYIIGYVGGGLILASVVLIIWDGSR